MDRKPQYVRGSTNNTRWHASGSVANKQYFANTTEGRISIRDIRDRHSQSLQVGVVTEQYGDCAILAIHQLQPILAISQGSDTQVYNLDTRRSTHVLSNNGRTITALCWFEDGSKLVTGSINGTVCIWDLSTSCVVARCRSDITPVRSITVSTTARIVFLQDSKLSILQPGSPVQQLASSSTATLSKHILCNPFASSTLLALDQRGLPCIWDLSKLEKVKATPTSLTEALVSCKTSFKDVVCIQWTGETTAAVLFEKGKKFALLDLCVDSFGNVEWELGFSHSFDNFILEDESGIVHMLSHSRHRRYPIPGKKPNLGRSNLDSDSESLHQRTDSSTSKHTTDVQNHGMRISSISIRALRKMRDHPSRIHVRSDDALTSVISTQVGLEAPVVTDHLTSPSSNFSQGFETPLAIKHLDSNLTDDISADLPKEDYFGSFSSATVHDSDSDDDTFDMKDSKDSTILRTGNNSVPLPRTCGAMFGANGLLIVFRPPQTKPAIPRHDILVNEIDASHRDLERTARLFPTFGNLHADLSYLTSVALNRTDHGLAEVLGLDNYHAKESWKPHSFSSLSGVQPIPLVPSSQVNVRHIDICSPVKQLASQYRILTNPGESGSEMCLANSKLALTHHRKDDAIIWQTLAKIVSESRDDSAARSHTIDWINHPLGARWLVQRIITLAERDANLQMLAHITACIIGNVSAEHTQCLGSMRFSLAVKPVHKVEAPLLPFEIPARTVDYSPPKQRTASAISSRNPSMPTTPLIASSTSTPPWSFSSASQSSRLSNSTSPEHTRSSFSAFKSYAQSMSDKFALYGTSPPIRKVGASPNNEYSSSVTSTGGSWTKSVSFAFTSSTSRSSTLGRVSFDGDDYDSDRTVEDIAVADSTPPDVLKVSWKNKEVFGHEGLRLASTPLIPAHLLPKCSIWVSSYAEKLRCMGLASRAVEFDKIGAVISSMRQAEYTSQSAGPSTDRTVSVVNDCSICLCIIIGLQQVCPCCQHSFHVSCLQQFAVLDESVRCPNGCSMNITDAG